MHAVLDPQETRLLYTIGKKDGTFELRMKPPDGKARSVFLGVTSPSEMYPPAWSSDGKRIAYALQEGGAIYIATLAGLRSVLQMEVAASPDTLEGQEVEASVAVTLRNLTPQDQKATVEFRVTPEPATPIPPVGLSVPAKGGAKHAVALRPGKRAQYRVVVTATGDEFDVQRETTFRVIESWNEKKRVVVLPVFDALNYDADKHAAGAAVWRMVMEKLSRLWQLRVANLRFQEDPLVLTYRMDNRVPFDAPDRVVLAARRLAPLGKDTPLVATDDAAAASIAKAYAALADYVVCGTVTANEQGLQAKLALVDVKAGKLLPVKSLEGQWPRDQLSKVGGDLANLLCGALAINVEPAQSAWLGQPMAANAEALEIYGRAVVPCFSMNEKEATELLLRAVAADPRFALAHRELARLQWRTGKWQDAFNEHEVAVALDPTDSLALAEDGEARYNMGRIGDAVKPAKAALALDPYNPRALRILGNRFYREQDYDKAEALLRRSLLDPYQAAYPRQEVGTRLGEIYAKAPRLDPKLRAPVELPREPTDLKTLTALLSKASGVTVAVTAPAIADKQVTLPEGKTTVGQAMEAAAEAVKSRWNRTEAGYFLMGGAG